MIFVKTFFLLSFSIILVYNIANKSSEFYLIKDEQRFCCDESQFKYVCKAHGESMGCYYHEFDYTENCEEQH